MDDVKPSLSRPCALFLGGPGEIYRLKTKGKRKDRRGNVLGVVE